MRGLVISILSAFVFYFSSCTNKKSVELLDAIYPKIVEEIFVDSVWVANRVAYDLCTVGNMQFVSYYDANRMMSVAQRKVGDKHWNKTVLPNKLTWDSHNLVSMGIDKDGYIHISGNMHNIPLVYFRSKKPMDVSQFEKIDVMVNEKEEAKVCYPEFFTNRNGDLFYLYRNGGSGTGDIYINKYDTNSKKWERLFDEPLFKGVDLLTKETRSAYHKIFRDNDGGFHIVWMWRFTPMVETCHQLCYITSKDLKTWYNAFGKEVILPLCPDNRDVIVDDVPSKGGLHNGKYSLSFVENNKPLIAYLKYDEKGMTQLYLSRPQNGGWIQKKISDWNFRWKFVGGGDKMSPGASFSFLGKSEHNNEVIKWSNELGEKGIWLIDPLTLEIVNESDSYYEAYPIGFADKIDKRLNTVQIKKDDNCDLDSNSIFLLRWEACKGSHGMNAPKVIPEGPVTSLVLYEISY